MMNVYKVLVDPFDADDARDSCWEDWSRDVLGFSTYSDSEQAEALASLRSEVMTVDGPAGRRASVTAGMNRSREIKAAAEIMIGTAISLGTVGQPSGRIDSHAIEARRLS